MAASSDTTERIRGIRALAYYERPAAENHIHVKKIIASGLAAPSGIPGETDHTKSAAVPAVEAMDKVIPRYPAGGWPLLCRGGVHMTRDKNLEAIAQVLLTAAGKAKELSDTGKKDDYLSRETALV